MLRRAAVIVIALSVLLPGCRQNSPRTVPHAPPPPANATALQAESGLTSPSGGSDGQQINDAMRGLLYETGLAERDPVLAPTVVPHPDPTQAPIECASGQRYLDDGQRAEAIAAFTRAVLNDLSNAPAYTGLGTALLRGRRTSECAAALRSGLSHDTELTAARVKLAVVEQMLTRYDAAAEQWREILQRDPDQPEARGRLAVLLFYQRDYAGAWAEIHTAEAAGQFVPPQLRELLAEQMPEP